VQHQQPVRILLVSQMYPGADAPDLGVFVRDLEQALEARGHTIDRAVLDTRTGGKRRYLDLYRQARAAAGVAEPDVVYAHFLVPSGLAASLASRAPLVVTAHGRDVRNIGELPGVAAATRRVVRRAARVIAVSDYLRRELETKLPDARGKVDVVDSGVDLERFRPTPAPDGPPAFLCVGSLTERKNVLRLADAFERLGRGTLTFAGDGPLRARLEDRTGIDILGPVPHDRIPELIARAHVVCGPSLIEPFGQALLEALACGRPVVATRIGGPPEFVPAEAGILVDPLDVSALSRALESALKLACPNRAARAAAEQHDVRAQAAKVEAILERAAASRPA
jgi:glycosyltransferase involved in cell wall biosynthesis